MVGVLLAVDHGLTATSRIAHASGVAPSVISRLLTAGERYGLLDDNRQDRSFRQRFHHVTGLSDSGHNLLAHVSAFALNSPR